MKNILMAGSMKNLIDVMKKQGSVLVGLDMPVGSDEQTATFKMKEDSGSYYYKTLVTYQVNEFDENDVPIAINVVDIRCTLECE